MSSYVEIGSQITFGGMDLVNKGGYSLLGLGAINVLVGKNGCGKSTLLRKLEESLRRDESIPLVRYLTPERSGVLRYQPNIEHSIVSNVSWLEDTRRKNQFAQFREQSVAQYRNLEIATLRRIQNDRELRNSNYTFAEVLAEINSLLDNIEIRPAESAFEIYTRGGARIDPDNISSGEAELISLAIEVLVFERSAPAAGLNLLLMDEPDLHLHPDLQHRFARFIAGVAGGNRIVLMATHSTSMIAALLKHEKLQMSFMRSGDNELSFREVGEVHKKVLPIFGAHPLSQVFNESPILLVEGEDDERVWQQAIRSSNGRLQLFPRSVGGLAMLNQFECEVSQMLQALYDEPVGYSLRDGDGRSGEELTSVGPLIRLRLNCRSVENLIVSDEVLRSIGTTWAALQVRIEHWLHDNPEHQGQVAMENFRVAGFDRRKSDLKQLRNILVALAGTTKPWEVVVGSVLAQQMPNARDPGPSSVWTFLGSSVVETLLQCS